MEVQENEGISEQVKEELLLITHHFWQALADRDIEKRFLQCSDSITFIGTGLDEKALGKSAYIAINKKGVEQFPEKFQLHILWERVSALEDMGWVENEAEWSQVINGKEEKTLVRNTVVLKKTDGKWWIVHVHGSVPDFRLSGQNYITNAETIKINRELESEVYKRTKELKQKNRELEIESCLERVRAVAMAMRKPDDMLEVCRMIAEQLDILGIKEIRNVQTAIIDEHGKGTYMNYQYFKQYEKGIIEEVEIAKHPAVVEMIQRMQHSPDAFHSHSFEGSELAEWIQYRKDENQFPDPILDSSHAVHFYFYSIGQGGLGLSGYVHLTEEDIDVFHRFRNVFTLAYQRFRDIELAEVQAREARIEAALERVRSSTMGMQKSEDLAQAVAIVFEELDKLDLGMMRCGIGILDAETHTGDVWSTLKTENGHVSKVNRKESMDIHPVLQHAFQAWLQQKDFSYRLEGEDLIQYYKALNAIHFDLPEDQKTGSNTGGLTQFYHVATFRSGGLFAFRSNEFPDEAKYIMRRFADVFHLTYTRFLDLQKAEAQAREAQIEAALERVRSKVMAMNNSGDLPATSLVFGEQLRKLGIDWQFSYFWLIEEHKEDNTFWITWPDNQTSTTTYSLAEADQSFQECLVAWRRQDRIHATHVGIEHVQAWLDTFERITLDAGGAAIDIMKPDNFKEGVFYYDAMIKFGSFGILINRATTEEEKNIQGRFAIEFERAYTRFLDLQKAEAQTREAKIEASLERVRSRAMAMMHSNELADLVSTVFTELTKLDFALTSCIIWINNPEKATDELWVASSEMNTPARPYYLKAFHHPFFKSIIQAWKKRDQKWIFELTGDEKQDFQEKFFERVDVLPDILKNALEKPEAVIFSASFSSFGALEIVGTEPLSDEKFDILHRFGWVFDSSYTRFNDLKLAEAQAREAKIEAALEKVRSRSLAMHKSDELQEVVHTVFEKLNELNVEFYSAIIFIFTEGSKDILWWLENKERQQYPRMLVPYDDNQFLKDIFEAKEKGKDIFSATYTGEVKNKIFHHLLEKTDFKNTPEHQKKFLFECALSTMSVALAKNTGLNITSYSRKSFSEQENEILKRFAKVFDQAYTRFLDLQKAEAQTREAQIESALEKVRGRAMAMHSSSDLSSTASMVFTELRKLGINPIRSGVALLSRDHRDALCYASTSSSEADELSLIGSLDMSLHPCLEMQHESWMKNENYFPILSGNELQSYYEVLSLGLAVPLPTDEQLRGKEYGYYLPFPAGFLYAWTEHPYAENELNILNRFKAIIDLTFRRYLDLQKAEAQAREAQIEAALERVRSRTMAMQKSEELVDASNVLFRELNGLGIYPIRTGVGTVDSENQTVKVWSSQLIEQNEIKILGIVPRNAHPFFEGYFSAWEKHEPYFTFELTGDALKSYYTGMSSILSYPEKTDFNPAEYFNVFFFAEGSLNVITNDLLTKDECSLILRFATVFGLIYRRFLDIKQAEYMAEQAEWDLMKLKEEKARTEIALTELKAAQAQLIQAEKMASLGELTAGIAHEIQNPLNFVNNFSEVNAELISELQDELSTGNWQQVNELAINIKENEEKIAFHGKRADAIVKGMLQHSRSSSGVKEPTDINALADEYLRLAYHGMRAKDKSFNATIKTDFDTNIGLISVVPQDIGRVILNLITNAFYAVSSPQSPSPLHSPPQPSPLWPPKGGKEFIPTVTVQTRNYIPPLGGQGGERNADQGGEREVDRKVEISVRDNGPGIPDSIKDKIFQPFFTTKPTGQGTGLGLSLSYDIVKAHGGELSVETKEGEGTTFIIRLPIH